MRTYVTSLLLLVLDLEDQLVLVFSVISSLVASSVLRYNLRTPRICSRNLTSEMDHKFQIDVYFSYILPRNISILLGNKRVILSLFMGRSSVICSSCRPRIDLTTVYDYAHFINLINSPHRIIKETELPKLQGQTNVERARCSL